MSKRCASCAGSRLRLGKRRVLRSRGMGIRSKVTEPVKTHMLGLVKSQPDLTLAELRERIRSDKGVSMSWAIWCTCGFAGWVCG